MKEPRWKDAFGRVPDSFSARVEGTLNEMNRMEGRQTMKRKIAWRAALAAALALAILTGTALALGANAGALTGFGAGLLVALAPPSLAPVGAASILFWQQHLLGE